MAKKTPKAKQDNIVVRYLRETWYELKKVSWPTRSEAINLTVIVIVATVFLSLLLGFLDWIFSTILGLLFGA